MNSIPLENKQYLKRFSGTNESLPFWRGNRQIERASSATH